MNFYWDKKEERDAVEAFLLFVLWERLFPLVSYKTEVYKEEETIVKKQKRHLITEVTIAQFRDYLAENEKSEATIQKYTHEIQCLQAYLNGEAITKSALLEYRKCLQQKHQATTVNSKLSAINHYLKFYELSGCIVKLLRIQHSVFVEEGKELMESEYQMLLEEAARQKQGRLYHLLLTICSTGIRVSEVCFITAEAVRRGKAEICLKGKNRVVILSKKLLEKLRKYMKKQNIVTGPVFCTRSGRALDRSNICHEMKRLSEKAGIQREKVHPHSLRHLFARSFYALHKNIAYLADIMGHSSIETTRIYVAASAREHERALEVMNLVI